MIERHIKATDIGNKLETYLQDKVNKIKNTSFLHFRRSISKPRHTDSNSSPNQSYSELPSSNISKPNKNQLALKCIPKRENCDSKYEEHTLELINTYKRINKIRVIKIIRERIDYHPSRKQKKRKKNMKIN